jgi:antitoxin PrlF
MDTERIRKEAKITSKGQVTIPREIRRALSVRTGDRLIFEQEGDGVRILPLRKKSPFAKYRGIGNPRMKSGSKTILRRVREMRGR